MIIKRIYVRGFRNIKESELNFSEGCNIFYGGNAQGKTNMLEAISICLGRSFRTAKNSAFIPFDKAENIDLQIKLFYVSDNYPDRENTVKYELKGENFKNCQIKITINDIPMKNASDLYGELKYVVFIPEDLLLIKGSPELRRFYLDNIAVLQNKVHKKIMSDYKNALQQRNALAYEISLRKDYGVLSELLSDWNDITVKQGVNLTYGRLKFFNLLKKYAQPIYSEISSDKEKLDLLYKSSVFGEIENYNVLDFNEKEQLYKIYSEKLNKIDIHEGFLPAFVKGPHRDDLIFNINGKNAREFGSQGQLRSAALIMKLSEAEIIRDYNKEKPVVLLDEVLGELDEERREFIVNHFVKSQVFITSCNINDFKKLDNIKLWQVKDGDFHA